MSFEGAFGMLVDLFKSLFMVCGFLVVLILIVFALDLAAVAAFLGRLDARMAVDELAVIGSRYFYGVIVVLTVAVFIAGRFNKEAIV
jgi:hypothetical protein